MKTLKTVKTIQPWWVFLAAVMIFYFVIDPMEWDFMPQCLFHRLTGLQCMGCGSQRVVHFLLHGDIISAFKANALLVCSLPLLIFMVFLEIRRTRYPRLYARIHSLTFIIGMAATLVLWLIVRNLFSI